MISDVFRNMNEGNLLFSTRILFEHNLNISIYLCVCVRVYVGARVVRVYVCMCF